MFYLVAWPNEARDLGFWPAHPPSFRTSIDRYSSETAEVARCLLEFIMAKNMGADPASLHATDVPRPTTGSSDEPLPAMPASQQSVGHVASHRRCRPDTVNDMPGLQIRRDGKWFAVDALDGALVLIVGDILEILSNGKCRCVVHQAAVHPSRERMSAAVFHRPCLGAVVGPLPEPVKDGGGRARYRSIGYLDFMKRYFSAKLDGLNHLDILKIDL
ncbi:S-norcoclaurine synthase 1-like [Panicum miliaceum]|uniref:S-norcoclaurine synthase 1-like n=1 Tax=Panicum miliaceum TaxID=4540 RepID=A0A3L6SC24_PANMI|nr:S-norcoclaurine synthase 1-like [Panicum miliaceum]